MEQLRKQWMKRAILEEQKDLYARVWDLYTRAEQSSGIVWGKFLTVHEKEKLWRDYTHFDAFVLPLIFWGGYEDADRSAYGIVSPILFAEVNTWDKEWAEYEVQEEYGKDYETHEEIVAQYFSRVEDPLSYIRYTWTSSDSIAHGDVLGASLHLGLDRKNMGDVLLHTQGADLIVLKQVEDVFVHELLQIKKTRVKAIRLDESSALAKANDDKKEKIISVQSMRLDALVSKIWNLSRDDAQAAINKDWVTVDGHIVNKSSQAVTEGQVIRFRKKGKAVIGEEQSRSRKARISLLVTVYGRTQK